MTVIVPQQKGTAAGGTPAAGSDLPDDTVVALDDRAADLFGLAADDRCPWPRFREAARRRNFDVAALAYAVQQARAFQAVPTSLEQFRGVGNRLRYRPIIYSVDQEHSGKLGLKLVFWKLTGEAEPELFNAFDRVRLVFNLATKFRRQVGEQHVAEAMDARNKSMPERVEFLRRVLYDIENLTAEAETEKLSDKERLIAAFDAPQQHKIRQMFAEWDEVYGRLRDAVDTERCHAPADLLRPMRSMNREFLLMSAERLRQLVSEFPAPDDDYDDDVDDGHAGGRGGGAPTSGTSARARDGRLRGMAPTTARGAVPDSPRRVSPASRTSDRTALIGTAGAPSRRTSIDG